MTNIIGTRHFNTSGKHISMSDALRKKTLAYYKVIILLRLVLSLL
jgi:hypothetical protein